MSEENKQDAERFKRYLDEIQSIAPITQEEEFQLGQCIAREKAELQKDTVNHNILDESKQAKQRLIEAHLSLVINIIQQYVDREAVDRGTSLMTLVEAGNTGLKHASESFDVTKGYRFGTYATWWIRQAITQRIKN
jgi:DNA-directed RNA polymerase sigma subunit (sigma70/sigma32)